RVVHRRSRRPSPPGGHRSGENHPPPPRSRRLPARPHPLTPSAGNPGARRRPARHSDTMMSSFVPGLELSRAFYKEVVRPLLADVPHSAALIGPGSDVLAFDTERSTDHDWGPRVLVFTPTARQAEQVEELAAARLPKEFGGYPTVFGSDVNPPRHGVFAAQAEEWLTARLGFNPLGEVTTLDWLAAPWQRLAEVTGGEVFHDGLNVLGPARAAL